MPDLLKSSEFTGNLFVISAPSGAGKSTLVKHLLENDPQLRLSISHTTRAPRGQETNGKEYWFISVEAFKERIEQKGFAEWAKVHENYYGTSWEGIQSSLEAGQDILLEIDWQGALQIKEQFNKAILIFILPPSFEELEKRLVKRGEDQQEIIAKRLHNAKIELSHANQFDFAIINDDFAVALSDLQSIVKTQRLRYHRQKNQHPQLFASLGA